MIKEEDNKVNLEEVYQDLERPHIIRTRRENKLLKNFADLMSTKSSFASHVHSVWKRIVNKNRE